MIFGLTLALASAVGTNVAFLFKHRGAVLARRSGLAIRYAAREAAAEQMDLPRRHRPEDEHDRAEHMYPSVVLSEPAEPLNAR